jgi:hypothetical protein
MFARRLDYFLVVSGGVTVLVSVVFFSFDVVVPLSHPRTATLTHSVSRIAVNFFIDAFLWVSRSHFESAHHRADLD